MTLPLAALLLGAASHAAPGPPPLVSAERVVFDNGLVVLLAPEPGSGLVSVGMMYRVGAKDESAGTTGLAHYAEHMNFRATARFPGHEITESITRRGGRWTGYTWIDQTFYQTTVQKEDLGLALDLEADRMGGALYDPAEFEAERTSVIAELRSYDDPHSLLYDEVLAAHFKVHPYRNNTIGWLTDIESVSRDAAFSFYQRFYHPGNAVLAVGGDFEREAALRAVRERFAPRPRGVHDPHLPTLEPPPSGERRVVVRKPGPHPEVLVAFRAPALGDPDFPALVLFDALLAGGKGLRFLTSYEARDDTPLRREATGAGARDAKAAFQASLYPYVYTVRAIPGDPAGLAEAEAALFRALEAAAEREWSDDERSRARAEVAVGLARDLDSLAGRVHQLAFFEMAGGFEHLRNIEARLASLDAPAVRRFARGRFTRERATVGWFVPTPGAPVFASGQAQRAPLPPKGSTAPAASPRSPDRAPPPVAGATATVHHLKSGLTLHVAPQPSTRLVALRGQLEAGAVVTGSSALSALAARLFLQASQAGSGPPLVLDLDEPGSSGHDAVIGFSATGLPQDLPAVAGRIARAFAANTEGLERARGAALAASEAALADTESTLAARARALLFPPGSPVARPPWGDANALRATSAATVAETFRRYVTPARAVLSVAGPVDPAQVVRAFDEALPPARSRPPTPLPTPLPPASPAGRARGPAAFTVVPVPREDASQNEIQVVVPGDRSRPHDAAATSLLLYLLGETFYSGRLGRALVEPGLVYSVWAELQGAPGLPGYLVVHTAASRENTKEVIRRIRDVLEEAARGAFTARELGEAKSYLRGKAARSADGALLAARGALEPPPPVPPPQSITLDQLNDTARRLFKNGAPIALVGGPGD